MGCEILQWNRPTLCKILYNIDNKAKFLGWLKYQEEKIPWFEEHNLAALNGNTKQENSTQNMGKKVHKIRGH